MRLALLPFALALFGCSALSAAEDAPYGGTVYTEPGVLTADDPSTYAGFSFSKTLDVEHYNDNVEDWQVDTFHRYIASFEDGHRIKVDVNDGFDGAAEREEVVEIYSFLLGQMPAVLRRGVKQMVLYPEGDSWNASTGEVNIHHGNYAGELADGALEESMIHETVHTSIDDRHAESYGWKQAQRADRAFISDYAAATPEGEDLAETFTLYLALALDPGRFSDEDYDIITSTIPNRIAYLEKHFPASKLGL